MNIWLISKYASPPQYSKAPSRLFYLAKEFVKLGNRVLLLTSDSNHFSNYPESKNVYNEESRDGVSIKWIKTKKYRKTASASRIVSWFDFERKLFAMNLKEVDPPEVVIVSSLSILSIVYGYFLKRKYKARLVFEIRDIWPLTMTEEGGFSQDHPLVKFIGWVEKFGYKKADLIVGTMPRLDLHVKDILGYDKPFFCSPLGFDPASYTDQLPVEQNPFRKLIPEERVVIGYAGSMGITNALEPFIAAIKKLDKNKKIYFLLVGSGDLKSGFELELKECENVIFLPRIEQSDVKYFLSVCDILYLSTKHSKVWDFGQSMNKVVEYMLASKPIIASYSGYQSMINEAGCGVFVKDARELENTIVALANEASENLHKMGALGREWIYRERPYSKLANNYSDAIKAVKSNV